MKGKEEEEVCAFDKAGMEENCRSNNQLSADKETKDEQHAHKMPVTARHL